MELTEGVIISLISALTSVLVVILLPLLNKLTSYFKVRRQGVTEKFVLKKQNLQLKVQALGEFLECQRVSVCMLHNGGNYFTGESVKRLSMVAEYVKKGSRSALLEMQGVLTTPYLRILNNLFTKQFVIERNTSEEKDLLSRINEEYEIKTSCTVGIFRKKPWWLFWKEQKRMIAFIQIGWDTEIKEFTVSDLQLILNYKDNIHIELIELSKEI